MYFTMDLISSEQASKQARGQKATIRSGPMARLEQCGRVSDSQGSMVAAIGHMFFIYSPVSTTCFDPPLRFGHIVCFFPRQFACAVSNSVVGQEHASPTPCHGRDGSRGHRYSFSRPMWHPTCTQPTGVWQHGTGPPSQSQAQGGAHRHLIVCDAARVQRLGAVQGCCGYATQPSRLVLLRCISLAWATRRTITPNYWQAPSWRAERHHARARGKELARGGRDATTSVHAPPRSKRQKLREYQSATDSPWWAYRFKVIPGD
ncbi:unnamed protein product [Periconia digitata]|uniref:Uncharacterized protein n=1 Tax=Periconia digitata TaxID=1303443 RepID=A0A9W4UFE8_9PLEO|nr:unnamed protein product [Periconia digitata]